MGFPTTSNDQGSDEPYFSPLKYSFPSPARVASIDVAILKAVGLSTRKAEYGTDEFAQRARIPF